MPTVVFDEKNRIATDDEIKQYRSEIEELPVTCADGTKLDVGDRSEKKLLGTIDRWALLNISSIDWTLADNTQKTMTLAELTAYTDEALTIRDLRVFPVHAQALAYKANPATTVRDLESWKSSYLV